MYYRTCGTINRTWCYVIGYVYYEVLISPFPYSESRNGSLNPICCGSCRCSPLPTPASYMHYTSSQWQSETFALWLQLLIRMSYRICISDMPHDRWHGLNQSMTRIGGHDITIRPAYSVVCRMQAMTSLYAGSKQCWAHVWQGYGPLAQYTKVRWYASSTHHAPTRTIRYAERVVVRRPVQLNRSLLASGSGFIINSERKSVQRLPGNGQDGGRAAGHVVTDEDLMTG